MGGNRKHGFMRGNANGRNGSNTQPRWWCDACLKHHLGSTFKTGYKGGLYCDRQYAKLKNLEFKGLLSAEFPNT